MKDPHTHVEKDLLCTVADMRRVIAEVTGLAADAPKTVATGCKRRRPYAMTSTVPEKVTCLFCRNYARDWHLGQAENCEVLLSIPAADAIWSAGRVTPAVLTSQAAEHRALAARFEAMP